MRYPLIVLSCSLLAASAWAQPADGPKEDIQQDKQDRVRRLIGITAAEQRLGEAAPIGRGVVLGHVEGSSGNYIPKVDAPWFEGVNFTNRSGPSKPFGHATGTASVIYGRNGLAPGVESVHLFASSPWLTDGYLRANRSARPPDRQPIRVFTHSWISDDRKGAEAVLRRVDFDVDRRGVVYCVGVNNRRTSAVPAMLASAHNVIAVGTAGANGASSGGYTRIERVGRCKPDIVGPEGLTSFTTPAVAACVARLLEAADTLPEEVDRAAAARPETIKAVLLAGATKPDFWQPEEGRPLDEHFGAGIAHFDRSLRILQGSRLPDDDASINTDQAWTMIELTGGQTRSFSFGSERPFSPLSIALAWHRRIAGQVVRVPQLGQDVWINTPRLADFDLKLVMIDDAGVERIVGLSDSEIDNVEHLYFEQLPAGRYRLDVTRLTDEYDEPWTAALAIGFDV